MSPRQEIAERIARFIRDNDLDNPFGGDAVRLDGDRFWHVLLSIPRTLDGIVKVYSPKFVQVWLRGQAIGGEEMLVFTSEDDALTYLKATVVDFDSDAAQAARLTAKKRT